MVCSRDREHIERAAAQIHDETGATVVPLVADVSREEEVQCLVKACVEHLGGLEIAVHNAGGPAAGTFFKLGNDQWYQAFNTEPTAIWIFKNHPENLLTNRRGRANLSNI